VIVAVLELENRADADDRFELDPAEIVVRSADHRARGLVCLGAWHTHPGGSAVLSERDHSGASEGWLSVVVGARNDLRAYAHGPAGTARELDLQQ